MSVQYARAIVNPPASTFMQVASLAKPEFLVEIDVIGVISRGQFDCRFELVMNFDGRRLGVVT